MAIHPSNSIPTGAYAHGGMVGASEDLKRVANHSQLSEEEKLGKVASEFEVMLVKQVLKSAQQPMTDEGSTFFPSKGPNAIYGDMMVDVMAQSVGQAGQLGLAALFQQQLSAQPQESSASNPLSHPF
jgi:Rod binding domain-containing protein